MFHETPSTGKLTDTDTLYLNNMAKAQEGV